MSNYNDSHTRQRIIVAAIVFGIAFIIYGIVELVKWLSH
jgi:hypothetical protein